MLTGRACAGTPVMSWPSMKMRPSDGASKPFVDPEILGNPSIYPDAATVKRMWAPLPWTPEQDSALARAWTEVRTG